MLADLRRIETMTLTAADSVNPNIALSGGDLLDELFGHLCGQLYHFVMARSKVMELYPGQLLCSAISICKMFICSFFRMRSV